MKKLFRLLIFTLWFLILACYTPNNNDYDNNLEPIIVKGTVKSVENYAPVISSKVIINNSTVFTDQNGYFYIYVKADKKKDYIQISKNRFTTYQKPLSMYETNNISLVVYLNR